MKKNKLIKYYMLLVAIMLSNLSWGAAVTFTGAGDGYSWSDAANWSSYPSLPTSSDDVTIPSKLFVVCDMETTVNSVLIQGGASSLPSPAPTTLYIGYADASLVGNLTVINGITMNSTSSKKINFYINDGTCTAGALSVQTGSTVSIDALQTLVVTGNISNGGSFTVDGTLKIGGTFSPIGLVNGTTSTIEFNGSVDQSIPAINFVNLTLSGIGKKTFTTSPSVSGTFTGSTSTSVEYATTVTTNVLTGSYNNVTFSGGGVKEISGDLTIAGTLTTGTGTVRYIGSADQTVMPSAYNGLEFLNGKKYITGTVTLVSGSFSPGSCTVEYNGSSSQTILAADYQDLILSGTGSKVISDGATIGIKSSFTSTASSVSNQGTFDYKGSSSQTITTFDYKFLTISGNRNGGTVTFGTNVGISEFMTLTASNVTYDLSTNASTVTYNGTSTQNIPNFTGGYYNLTCDNSTKQFSEAVTVNNNLTITNDAVLKTNGNLLTIGANFTNNGTFTPTTSDIVRFTGSSKSTISGTSTTAFENLNINKTSNTVEINSPVTISSQGAVTIETTTSTLAVNTGSLTLLSTSAVNTARIATIPSGSTVTGNVTTQRYIPIPTNATLWWHLGSIVQGVTVANWQTKFPISGNFTGRDVISGASSGAENNWSLKTYNEAQVTTTYAQGWKNFPTTSEGGSSATFTNGQGYRAYIVDTKTTSSPKTLSMSGNINQGDFTFPMTFTPSGVTDAQGYAFLSNPYPSAIDFSHASWTKTNVSNEMYVWDAISKVWRGWTNSGGSYNGGTSVIPIGQGFWVQATATSPVLKVTESAKTTNLNGLKRIAQVQNNIEVALTATGNEEDVVTTDIRFSDMATSNYDVDYDASYLSRNMFTEFTSQSLIDICSKTAEGKKLFVNHVPLSETEIIPLVLTGSTAKEYTLTVAKENYSIDSDVYLVDLFLNKEVKIEDVTAYTFSITNDAKSAIKERFQVKVNNSRVLATEKNLEDLTSNYIVYPNPSNGQSLVVKATQSYTNVGLVVKDILGNTVYSELVTNMNSGFEKEIKFSKKLESGIYFINFITNNKTITQKVVVE